ncbi:ergothioneine biosynthesis protein EgtB [Gordonia aichiensis]|uniref:ergothioneine biosynthesis protein EgtB n=1 Tax=Gordonia aichiensis TaxID=36820 RepID=UPI0032647BC1
MNDAATILLGRYEQVRTRTEQLAAPLSPEDQTVQSMPDVSPTKWHRAHVTWFFETFVLAENEPDYAPFHDRYGFLFNSYYESIGPRYSRPDRGHISRPGAADVARYRADVDRRMADLLAGLDAGAFEKLAPIVELGLNHEQQHQELLLMDIKHVLSCNPLEPVYAGRPAAGTVAGPLGWRSYDGGLVEVGHRPASDGTFCYDNETPRHREYLEPFRLADRLVTNGEWREFMADGGYRRPELWLSDGWATVNAQHWRAPLYWREHDGEWTEHTLSGTGPVDPTLPVCHVSHYEADAYARWSGHRLPTEAEVEHATRGEGARSDDSGPGAAWHPRAAGPSDGTLRQLAGHCWQWTSSAYLPYPRFRPAPGAVGEYNGKFMSGQMVLRGGSAFTPVGHTRASYRNFFPPAARWPLTGVRLAADEPIR